MNVLGVEKIRKRGWWFTLFLACLIAATSVNVFFIFFDVEYVIERRFHDGSNVFMIYLYGTILLASNIFLMLILAWKKIGIDGYLSCCMALVLVSYLLGDNLSLSLSHFVPIIIVIKFSGKLRQVFM